MMGNLRLGWGLALVGLLAGCGSAGDSPESEGELQTALEPACSVDADCASGFVCWTSGASCERASSCYSGSTGAGVFVGSLTVDATDTAADLQSLGNAWCVTGDVTVKKTSLTDLTGLGSVLTVAGNVSIEDNSSLLSLDGLNGLRRTSKVALFRNSSLASLTALSKLTTVMSLQVYINPALTDLNGLQNVTSISGAEVVNNAGLTSLTGLDSVANAYSFIDIRLNPRLTNLAGLGSLASVSNLVQIMDNPQLQSLQGLGKLATIGNTLRVMRNAELDDLKGLAKLTSARTFQVSDNAQLDSCNVSALATSVAADCSGCVRNGPCLPPDNCPDDPAKLEPGVCGCGVADTDGDADGVPDCQDTCAGHDDHVDVDANGIADGCQDCVTAESCDDGDPRTTESCVDTHCVSAPTDFCPEDPEKLEPGICGCGVAELDSDADGVFDCQDQCAGSDDHVDTDANGIPDGCQQCVTAASCDDGNPCTTDSCVAAFCANVPNTGASCGVEGKCSTSGACVEPLCKFKLLGALTDVNNSPSAVSSDGRTIAGTSSLTTSTAQAFRWTAERGRVPLFTSYSLVATTISGDGLTIGGYTTGSSQRAFVEGSTGPIFASAQSAVKAMSANGRFLVGQSNSRAYRWDARFTFPTLLNIKIGSIANDISADGSVIVGQGQAPNDLRGLQAVVFSGGSTTGLGDFKNNPNTVSSNATAVSANGRIVVGTAADTVALTSPFRWTRETGLVKIEQSIVPVAVNDNGMILGTYSVIGSSIGDGDLRELLIGCGADIASSQYLTARDMTPDGKTIVGSINYGGPRNHAFKVELP